MATGDLPEQIEQLLTKVQKINDLFLRVEPKLRTIIERYLASGINDKIQNGNIVETLRAKKTSEKIEKGEMNLDMSRAMAEREKDGFEIGD